MSRKSILGNKSRAEVREIYDGAARSWWWVSLPDTISGFNLLRRKHFEGVTGEVLDVGCGTGENFKYLRGARSVTAAFPGAAPLASAGEVNIGSSALIAVDTQAVMGLRLG